MICNEQFWFTIDMSRRNEIESSDSHEKNEVIHDVVTTVRDFFEDRDRE